MPATRRRPARRPGRPRDPRAPARAHRRAPRGRADARGPHRAAGRLTPRAPRARRAGGRATAGHGRRAAAAGAGARVAHAGEPAQGGPHEQLEPGEDRQRVAGERDHQPALGLAGPRRLARLQRDAPEQLAHAKGTQRRLDVIVRAHRDAARREHEVGSPERALEGGSGRVRIVRHPLDADELGAERRAAGGQEAAVRLVDLAAPERLGRRAQLVARHHHGDARPAVHRDRRDPRGAQRGERERDDRDAGGEHLVAVAPDRCRSRARGRQGGRRPRSARCRRARSLARPGRRVCPVGHDAAGRDPRGRAGGQRGGILPRGRTERDRQGRAGVCRPHGVAVHRRAREGRQVERRTDQLGEHAAHGPRIRRDLLDGQRPAGLEQQRAGLVGCQQRTRCHAQFPVVVVPVVVVPVVVGAGRGRAPSCPPGGVGLVAGRRVAVRRALAARVDRPVGLSWAGCSGSGNSVGGTFASADGHVVVPDLRGQRRAGDDSLALDVLHRDRGPGGSRPRRTSRDRGCSRRTRRPRSRSSCPSCRPRDGRRRAARGCPCPTIMFCSRMPGHDRGDAVGDGAAVPGLGERSDERRRRCRARGAPRAAAR